jgi:acyl-CoA reductase-like NAD-dependent aldehyde dehydrogenase
VISFPLTIGGRSVKADATFDVFNPATGELLGKSPKATTALVDEAVEAARQAFVSWSRTSDAERVGALNDIAASIEQHSAELSKLVTLEQGKPQSGLGANFELGGCVAWTRVTAGLSLPEETIQDDSAGRIVVRRKPVGVVGSITPWNWPLLIATWHVMPALRVGATIVIKPSPYTSLATLRYVEIIAKSLPPGVINIVTGEAEVGSRMVSHPGIDKIVFTGSIKTGKGIMRGAADSLKRLTLELGGNDAGIVLPGTDLSPLMEKLFWGCFINSGQTCAALKRLYVHEAQYDRVVEQFSDFAAKIPVGDGMDPATLIGPLTNRPQLDKVKMYVKEALTKGARIAGSPKPAREAGFFHVPTVVADATDDMLLVAEEQFGTAIPVLKYRTVEEAVTRANALQVGLGGSVWGDNLDTASEVALRLACGTAWVNQHGALHPMAPFGGIKSSGIGSEFSVDGLKEYTTIQVMNVAR